MALPHLDMIEEKSESAKVIFNVRSWKIKQKMSKKIL